MRICVVGGGVVGLATAYRLVNDGHEVTVLERNDDIGREASYANGAQLSYSYVAPLADAGVLSKVPAYLFDSQAPLRFRPRVDPAFWSWCFKFAARCNVRDARATTVALLRLGSLSCQRMREWAMRCNGATFSYRNNGKLVVYRDAKALAAAGEQVRFQNDLGSEQRVLTVPECVEVEPALAAIAPHLVGGIYMPHEDVADSHRFCRTLADWLLQSGNARILFNTRFERFIAKNGSVCAVDTSAEEIDADAVVVAAGIDSRSLLRPAGVSVPLLGLKGYSITIKSGERHRAPTVSITDNHHKIVFAKLDGRLRVAGMVELGECDTDIDAARIDTLTRQARENFPEAGDFSELSPWAGIRPATPSGRPIIDRLGYENLFVNIGHGMLGFTLAMGSAELTADLIAGRQSSIDGALFRLANA
jgi:D-amino-acid dehydrogenase